jgi:hypothetical protein
MRCMKTGSWDTILPTSAEPTPDPEMVTEVLRSNVAGTAADLNPSDRRNTSDWKLVAGEEIHRAAAVGVHGVD